MPRIDNICILGEWLGGKSDEGYRNFGNAVIRNWRSETQVATLIPEFMNNWDRFFFNPEIRRAIAQLQPQHIVYLSPSNAKISALFRLKSLKPAAKKSRLWIVALQADNFGPVAHAAARLLKPDGVISQSPLTMQFFEKLGVPSFFSPSGVDLDKFKPAGAIVKSKLRQKYGVPEQAFVLLHVGHLSASRNLETLGRISEKKQVYSLLVSSTSTPHHPKLENDLAQNGVRVIKEYLPDIEEVFRLADAYIFPTIDAGGAINVPLSVMEAMACNLPVISTPFGGLVQMFPNCEGCFFYEDWDQLSKAIECAQVRRDWATRSLVEKYTWKNVAGSILTFIQNNS